ncbi:hypothetical protein [Actinophytocola sp.]|uniref:hypothetical protein n=1 Tax=Actinophytocola sp. TaxID=1872138 RepID=UPI00389AD0EA
MLSYRAYPQGHPASRRAPSPEPGRALFLVTLDGEPRAYAAGHGQSPHRLGA